VKRKEPTKLYLLGKRVPEERQILTTGFNPVIRKEPTKLYLLGKKVPEERQILTTGFNPVKKVVVFLRGAYATIAITVSPSGL